MKSSRLLISRIRLWKNISGSPSNRLDSWKRHTNQEVGGGWWLTGHAGWRLGGGTLRSLGDAWGDLRRRRYRVGRPHSSSPSAGLSSELIASTTLSIFVEDNWAKFCGSKLMEHMLPPSLSRGVSATLSCGC
ncbi:uncharacterized protein LOC111064629 [Nilaparvata lugens]|uniref:uncharacterized protein LOC111064629 n=1 Tax=Nilaparvata lugens TaxID=108931 RepID=UPI00193E1EAB|nr:uncharacterized protein LOC111064629 [Nilaparvata lugens]